MNIHPRNAGFTLIELVVAIAVIALLAGIVIPMVGDVQEDAKVSKMIAIYETCRKAVVAHKTDTGRLATEYSGSSYQGAQYHHLSLPQTYTGWKGPYIDHPLTQADNPFEGFVYIYNSFNGGAAKPSSNRFQLTGSSGPALTGAGQFLAFSKVPQAVAQKVDDAIDKGIPGTWSRYGKVEWSSSNGGTLIFYLMDD